MQVPDSVSAAISQFQLHLEFPHAFTDDDEHAFSYTSGLHPTKKAAQNEAALEVIVALLVVAPKGIRMVPSCFKGGSATITELRSAAEAVDIVDRKVWQAACGQMWSQRSPEIELEASGRADVMSIHKHVEPASGSSPTENDEEVKRIFLDYFRWSKGGSYVGGKSPPLSANT